MRPLTLALAALLLAAPAHAGKKNKKGAEPAPAPAAEAPAADTAPVEGMKVDGLPEVSEGSGPLVTVPCTLEKGASWSFGKTSHRAEIGSPAYTLSSDITVNVLEVDGTSAVISWSESKPRFDEAELAANPKLQAMAAAPVDDTAIELQLTEGQITGIRNQQALIDANKKMVDALLAEMGTEGPEADAMRQMMGDPNIVIASALQGPQALLGGSCIEMKVGEVVQVPIQLPNPMTGNPLPAILTASMPAQDADAGTVTVGLDTRVDPEAATAAAKELLKTMAGDMGVTEGMVDAVPLPNMKVTTTSEFVLDTGDGMPQKATATKIIEIMGQGRTDTWTFTRTDS